MKVRFVVFPALALTVLLGAACDVHVGDNGVSVGIADGRATEEWERTYTVQPAASLEIVNVNGGITIKQLPETAGAKRPLTITVTALKRVRAKSDEEAKAALQQLAIREDVTPDAAGLARAVKLQWPSKDGGDTLFRRTNLSIDYRVTVPAGLTLTLRTQNGGVVLQDVDGKMTAATTNGGVRGHNLSGTIGAHTVNGGVVLDVARPSGPIEIDSVNGGIRLDLPRTVKADVEGRAVNGGVNVSTDFQLAVDQQERNVFRGRINGGGVKVLATTVNGGVRVIARGDGTVVRGEDEGAEVLVNEPQLHGR
jgi:DUF4097 and DUF4098 domain-containing protein YvlB